MTGGIGPGRPRILTNSPRKPWPCSIFSSQILLRAHTVRRPSPTLSTARPAARHPPSPTIPRLPSVLIRPLAPVPPDAPRLTCRIRALTPPHPTLSPPSHACASTRLRPPGILASAPLPGVSQRAPSNSSSPSPLAQRRRPEPPPIAREGTLFPSARCLFEATLPLSWTLDAKLPVPSGGVIVSWTRALHPAALALALALAHHPTVDPSRASTA
ncbi:hypothetical protein C8Q78DRAFT_246062 [Trametes maxima]|nr:hypothetical protein C8Q78DRAFT_246062 [Trametes maxima]